MKCFKQYYLEKLRRRRLKNKSKITLDNTGISPNLPVKNYVNMPPIGNQANTTYVSTNESVEEFKNGDIIRLKRKELPHYNRVYRDDFTNTLFIIDNLFNESDDVHVYNKDDKTKTYFFIKTNIEHAVPENINKKDYINIIRI